MKLKVILPVLLMILLVLPFIQQQFKIFNNKPLYGFTKKAEKTKLTLKSWFDGSWQLTMDEYLKENIGFRPFFVRIQNQIQYSVFSKSPNEDIFIGKEGVLYQYGYLDAYKGIDFIGADKINKRIKKLKTVQAKLKERGINLLVILAPGKASIYPEFIPDQLLQDKKDSTNYQVLVKALSETNIDFIDFRNYFLQIKDTTKYPLFPKNGTHWSGYSVTLVADSMFRYIREKYHYDLTKFKSLPGYESESKFRYTDNDLEKVLNVFTDLDSWKLYYPTVLFEDTSKIKPNAYIVGDSYSQSFLYFYPYYASIFSRNSMVWSKYEEILWPENKPFYDKSHFLSDIKDKDLVILEATEINYSRLAFEFVDYANFFLTSDSLEYDRLMNKYTQSLKQNPNWLSWVKQRAVAKNISLDEEIRRNAFWMLQQDIINKE